MILCSSRVGTPACTSFSSRFMGRIHWLRFLERYKGTGVALERGPGYRRSFSAYDGRNSLDQGHTLPYKLLINVNQNIQLRYIAFMEEALSFRLHLEFQLG